VRGIRTTRVEASESGVMRDTTEGKLNSLLVRDGPMFKRWALLLTRGVSVRGKRNWMNASTPEDLERFRESATRHFEQWLDGEEDEDHAAAIFFNVNGAEYTKARLSETP
jgi:NDP-sugar pyrophosphorylase family protein